MVNRGKSDKTKLTPFQEEQLKVAKKVKEYKLSCEANVVSIFYKQPDLLFDYELKLEDISENAWRVYFQIAHDVVVKERKPSLDELTVGFYLEKHSKLKEKYDEYGGWQKIIDATAYVNPNNISGYVKDLNKWNVVLKLIKYGFPVADKLSDYSDMSADEIYSELETLLNHTFINIDGDISTYTLDYKIDELLENLNEGQAIGLPYYNMPMLTAETGGQLHGNITLVGGLSNVGKSTFARSSTLPSIIENKEKIVIMVNEDGLSKWQREMIVWCANNIFKEDLQKFVLRNGKYTDDVWVLLKKCSAWIKEISQNHTITIIPFQRYKTDSAIKIIKKYAGMGVKYFMLDTFKADAGSKVFESSANAMAMSQAMVDIQDTVKEANKDVHILITFQLAKGSAKQRYYTQDNTGIAKNITDVASTNIMIRDLFDDEKAGGKNTLKVFRLEGKNGKSKISVQLSPDKHYQIIFIVKNREGSANQFQIVVEHDMSRNIMKEVGITYVTQDF